LNKETFINKIPDKLFAFLVNMRRQKLYGDRISIERREGHWLIRSGKIQLYSYTPKMTSFGMGLFAHKFERIFKIEPGDVCLDVGACIGDTTIPMAIKSEYALVLAVEPEKSNLIYLRKNIQYYPTIKIRAKAISNRTGSMDLHVSNSITGHSLIPDEKSRIVDKVIVSCETLDDLQEHAGPFDFAKIDVQGSEADIFQTASKFLGSVKKLVVETHDFLNEDKQTARFVMPYLEHRFSFIEMTGKGVIHCRK